ncbi:hypothetical protein CAUPRSCDRAFT_12325 [Caulochytrium protostelioides]|uniref:Uncharacterized protein n=1 Tax=Caulochytrium protostelioides TaxID=1555241 RepID=A0A4P9WUL9_9FUNG|nr:hypothetical protein CAUPRSCDRAFT_12325 [Caulochytrium protostelioides]
MAADHAKVPRTRRGSCWGRRQRRRRRRRGGGAGETREGPTQRGRWHRQAQSWRRGVMIRGFGRADRCRRGQRAGRGLFRPRHRANKTAGLKENTAESAAMVHAARSEGA